MSGGQGKLPGETDLNLFPEDPVRFDQVIWKVSGDPRGKQPGQLLWYTPAEYQY